MIGPPISTVIIPPSNIPKITLLEPPIEFKAFVRAVLIAATGGLIINVISNAINNNPKNGYKRTGFNPSNVSGK